MKSGLFVSLLKYRRSAHNSSPSSRARRMTRNIQRVFLAAAALACGETPTAPPLGVPTPLPMQVVEGVRCVVDTRTRQMSCGSGEEGSPTATRSRSGGSGINVDLIVGGQNTFIKLTSSNVTYSGEVFSFTTTVQNLIPQSLGTSDGTTLDTAGVKVFFEQEPVFTSGSGTIDFVDPIGGGSLVDGFATFTRANQPYYKYNQIVHPNEVSAGKLWRMHVPTTVTSFSFTVYVSAPVQYPTGWVDVTPAVTVLQTGQTQQLTAVVRDVVGRAQAGAPVTWGTTNASAATVDASGLVTAAGDGAATITATSTTRRGTALITVATPTVLNINAGDGQTALVGAAVATAPSVVVLDQNGAPVPNIQVTFSVTGGGGSATTLVATTNASGIATVGSWTLGAGGVGCAAATITNCTRNTLHAVATGGASPAVDIKGYIPPIVPATATYQAVGNSTLPVVAGIGVLQGAFSINGNGANGQGATLTVTTPSPVGSQSGTVTIAGDGSFGYLSSPTYVSVGAATENFTFTVTDGIASITSNAALQVNVPEHVWYVQPSFGGTSTGSDVQPFKDFSGTAAQGVEAAAAANDTILVFSGTGTAAGGTLKNTQFVYGQGATAPKTFTTGAAATYRNGGMSIVLLTPSGIKPLIGALTLGVGNSLSGLELAGGSATALTGTGFGTLTVSEVIVNSGAFQALNLVTGTLSGAFASVTSTGGVNNVLLSGVATVGTGALGSGALSGASSDAFRIIGGTGTFTYSGSIANATALAVNISTMSAGGVTLSGSINTLALPGRGIAITSNTGGSFGLLGQDIGISSGTVAGVSITGNSAPVTVNLSPSNVLQIATTTGTGFNATGAGTINLTAGAGNTINSTGGQALNVSGVTVGANGLNFNSVSSAGGTNNIALVGVGGTAAISLGTGVLTGATSTSFTVSGVSGNPISYAGTITKSASAGGLISIASHNANTLVDLSGTLTCTSCGTAVSLNGNSSGTIQFTSGSKVFSTGASTAVNLTSNTGTTVAFTNGGLAMTTTSGNGFSASGGGTVTVQGSNNTVTSTTGTAVNVNATTIGVAGLTFRSVAANGGNNGISLITTGALGGLTVTGDGATQGSGGTIVNTTGSGTSGTGVYMSNARNVSLNWMALSGHAQYAVYGTEVTNFTMNKTRITGTNGVANVSGGAMYFANLYGSSSITNSNITGGGLDNVHIFNGETAAATASLNRVTFDTDTIFGNFGVNINIAAYKTAVVNATIQNSRFTSSRGSTINFATNENSSGDVIVGANTLSNNDPNQVSGTTGIFVGNASSGSLTYSVSANTVNGMFGSGIEVDRAAGGAGSLTGTISSNVVGTTGVAGSGSRDGSAIFVGLVSNNTGVPTHTSTVSGNIVKQFGNVGIKLVNRGPAGSGGAYLNATVQGNDIREPNTATTLFPSNGIRFDIGAASTDDGRVCAIVSGNTTVNAGTNGESELRVRGRFLTRTGIPGGAASPNTFYEAANTFTGATTVNATSTPNVFQNACPPT